VIRSQITDPKTKLSPAVVNGDGEEQALVVATRPLKTYINNAEFFTNDEYGNALNQDASSGGTPIRVHDGIDTSLWTASSIAGGKFTFNSTDQAKVGSRSVKTDNAAVNNIMQFAKGSSQALSAYISLSMWIYVDKDWKAGDSISIYGWDGALVGNEVLLEDYFDWSSFDVWQQINIPFSAMGLSAATVDSFRIQILTKEGKSPKFYLDEIQIEETGTPIEFTIEPEVGTWLHVDSLNFTLADAYAGTVGDGTMPSLAYNSLLGVSALATGLRLNQTSYDGTDITYVFNQLLDFMTFNDASIVGSGSDGTNTWVTVQIKFAEPLILKAERLGKLTLTVNDNLSGLLVFKVSANAKAETR